MIRIRFKTPYYNNKSPIKKTRRNIAETLQLKRSIEDFEFVFLLVVFSKILGAIDLVSKYLQYEKADLCLAIHHVETGRALVTDNSVTRAAAAGDPNGLGPWISLRPGRVWAQKWEREKNECTP